MRCSLLFPIRSWRPYEIDFFHWLGRAVIWISSGLVGGDHREQKPEMPIEKVNRENDYRKGAHANDDVFRMAVWHCFKRTRSRNGFWEVTTQFLGGLSAINRRCAFSVSLQRLCPSHGQT
jgi:hypothetical protein